MDLIAEVARDNLPLKQVQSDECESTSVFLPVHADIKPFHKPYVHIEVEVIGGPGSGVRPLSGTGHIRDSDETVKIGDAGGLGARARQKKMKNLQVSRGEQLNPSGNRFRELGLNMPCAKAGFQSAAPSPAPAAAPSKVRRESTFGKCWCPMGGVPWGTRPVSRNFPPAKTWYAGDRFMLMVSSFLDCRDELRGVVMERT